VADDSSAILKRGCSSEGCR